MKVFLCALFWLLLFEDLQGSTLSRKRPIRSLNTTLQTNFRGTYEKKNPCTDTEIETSSYVASHELHHHTRGDNWSDYTDKCSAIISNFLQTIANLIKFNHKPNGSFNFYLNTSISRKQDVSGNRTSCDCLPTIVIEATDCKIPLNPNSHTSDKRNSKNEASEDKFLTDKFTNEPVPSAGIPGQQDARIPTVLVEGIPVTPCPVTHPSEETVISAPPQYTTPEYSARTGGEWFEEKTSADDNLSVSPLPVPESSFSKTSSPSAPLGGMARKEDLPPAVFYELSKDTQSTYEPKATYFKTSLRLTPQTDPENGTVQPRIHYMTANLVTDPFQSRSPTNVVLQNSFPQPGRPEAPLPLPERPDHQTKDTTPTVPPYNPLQVSTSTVGPTASQNSDQNQSLQLSVTGKSEPPLLPTELQPAEPSSVPQDQVLVNPINDPEFQVVPLRSQTTTAPNLNREIPTMQLRPVTPFDIPPTLNSPNSKLYLPDSSPVDRNQPEGSVFPKASDEPIPGPFQQVGTESLLPFAGNQVGAQQIPTPPQQLPAQQPYHNRFPSTIPPPTDTFRTFEEGTGSPPLALEPRPFPNYFGQIPQENRKQTDDTLSTLNQPSVTPHTAVLPPVASNPAPVIISSPEPEKSTVPLPAIYPVGPSPDFNAPNTYLDQQPIDNQSTEKLRSSSVTISTEETITTDQELTPVPPLQPYSAQYPEQVPESISSTFDPRFRSEPNLHPYKSPKQPPLILPEYPQPPSPIAGPLSSSNVGQPKDELLIAPPDFRPESSLSTPDYSSTDSQKPDTVFTPNNDQVQVVPEAPIPMPQRTFAPDYNLQSGGPPLLYATTPRPYTPTLNNEQNPLNSPIASLGPPTAVDNYQDPQLATGNVYALPTPQKYPQSKPNFQGTPQQLVPTPEDVAEEFPVTTNPLSVPSPTVLNYPEQVGTKEPPASDSLVRSDYQTTPALQPYSNNFNSSQPLPGPPLIRFTPPPSDSTSPYDSASASQATGTQSDLSEQEPPSETAPIVEPAYYGLELKPLPTDSRQTSSDLLAPLIPPPSQGSLDPANGSQQPSANDFPPPLEPPIIGGPVAVLPQVQLDDPNRLANTEQNFQPSESATPIYAIQPSEENVRAQFMGGQQTRQTPDSALPLQPVSLGLFPGSGDPSVQQLPAFPRANALPENIDVNPADFPTAAEQSDQESNFNRPPAFPDGFVPALPTGDRSPEIGPQQPNLQLPNSSDQFLSLNSQEPPASSPLQSQVPAFYGAKPEPIISPREFPSPLEPPYQPPFQPQNVSPAPFLLQDASVSTDPPAEYPGFNPTVPPPLQTEDDAGNVRNSHETSKLIFPPPQSQPFSSDYAPSPLDGPSQMRPHQVPDSIPGIPITSNTAPSAEPQFRPPQFTPTIPNPLDIRGPVIETPVGNNQAPEVLLPSDTNSVQSAIYPQVTPAEEIVPTTKAPANVKSFTPDQPFTSMSTDSPMIPEVPGIFDGTSPAPQPYVNDGLYPSVSTIKPPSDDSGANLQEAINNEQESRPNFNDFGQNPTTSPVAYKDVAADPSGPSRDFTTYETTTTEETTTESVANSDQFYGDNIQVPLRELPQPEQNTQNVFFGNMPPSVQPSAVGDQAILTPQQQFLPPVPQQPPNYADRRLDGPPSSITPVGPPVLQQTPETQPPLRPALNFAPAAAAIPNPDNITPAYVPLLTPGTPLTYPNQVPSNGDKQNLPYGDSVGSPSPSTSLLQGPIAYTDVSQTAALPTPSSQPNSDSDMSLITPPLRSTSLSLQDKPYSQPPPTPVVERGPDFYAGDRPNPPPPMQYPSFNQQQPPFYAQQQTPINFPQNTESVFPPQEAAMIETFPDRQTETPLAQPDTVSNGTVQLVRPGEGSPVAFVPAYPPTQLSNFNAVRPDGVPPAYFGSPGASPYSANRNQQVELPNDPTIGMENVDPPVFPPPTQRSVDNDQQMIRTGTPVLGPNFDATPGRKVDALADGQTERSAPPTQPDSRLGFTPYGPPASPSSTPPVMVPDSSPHTNPLLQALESHLVIPMQERPYLPPGPSSSLPGRSDQNAQLSLDRKTDKNIRNIPTYPAGWNPGPSTNFVNPQGLQPNTAPQPDPHALVPGQTTPSNKPDPTSTGRFDYMASPLRNSFYADRMRPGSGPEGL